MWLCGGWCGGGSCGAQGNDDARKKGIGIVMRKDGSIIRRGIGQVGDRRADRRHRGHASPKA